MEPVLRFRFTIPLLTAAFLAAPAAGHQQPTTLLMLDAGPDDVAGELHLPLTELEPAFGHSVSHRPEVGIGVWGAALGDYLRAHIRPLSREGRPWRVDVDGMRTGRSEQAQSGPFEEIIVDLTLAPPPGANPRDFVLHYDAVLHQVVTHKALVSIRSHWAGGQVEPGPARAIFTDTGTGRIEPIHIELEEGSPWRGFRAMTELGARHIREGTDHLLFLLVLLLPATMVAERGRWSRFAGSRESMVRLAVIVSAFTFGHSVTLLAGALRWLTLPQRPVEILIACSVLVTAIHAWRPLFPGREARVAAGFGLVHGLAFATVLTELRLDGAAMALSILGFNLGIEAMQLVVIALTVPWLILLSLTPAHRYVRQGGAILAAAAACGWILNRVTAEPNAIERVMNNVTAFAPFGIFLLAAIAIPAYLHGAAAAAPHPISEKATN